MKKKILFLGVIFIIGAAVLFAQSQPTVTIVNNTGYTIYYIYISESRSDDWEEDILGDDVLRPGASVNCRLPNSGTWDFLAIDEDGDEYKVMNIRIPPNNRINIGG